MVVSYSSCIEATTNPAYVDQSPSFLHTKPCYLTRWLNPSGMAPWSSCGRDDSMVWKRHLAWQINRGHGGQISSLNLAVPASFPKSRLKNLTAHVCCWQRTPISARFLVYFSPVSALSFDLTTRAGNSSSNFWKKRWTKTVEIERCCIYPSSVAGGSAKKAALHSDESIPMGPSLHFWLDMRVEWPIGPMAASLAAKSSGHSFSNCRPNLRTAHDWMCQDRENSEKKGKLLKFPSYESMISTQSSVSLDISPAKKKNDFQVIFPPASDKDTRDLGPAIEKNCYP